MTVACDSWDVVFVVDVLLVAVDGELVLMGVFCSVVVVVLLGGVVCSESDFLPSCSFPSVFKNRDIVAAMALLSVLTCSFLILCSVVTALAGRPLVAPILPRESRDPLVGSGISFAFFPPVCSVVSASVCASRRFSFVFVEYVCGVVSE